jgi:hypothetical protein
MTGEWCPLCAHNSSSFIISVLCRCALHLMELCPAPASLQERGVGKEPAGAGRGLRQAGHFHRQRAVGQLGCAVPLRAPRLVLQLGACC